MTRWALIMAGAFSVLILVISRRWAEWLGLFTSDLFVFCGLAAGVGATLLLIEIVRHRDRDVDGRLLILAEIVRRYRDGERCLARLAASILAAALTFSSYNVFKQFVLPATRYWMGKPVADADRALMLGHDAWQVTHALLPYAWESAVLDTLYHGWFVPMGVGVVLCGFARTGCRIAGRYAASYVATWAVQGTVLAWFFPAAGPCFVSDLKHVERFRPLTDLLAAQDRALQADGWSGLAALHYQRGLLQLYHSGEAMLGGGIAAMPSLHNALAVLFACAAWQLHRALGWLFTIFALLIWIGSVHLGWHYALDGVVGGGFAYATWALFGALQRAAAPAGGGVLIDPVPVLA